MTVHPVMQAWFSKTDGWTQDPDDENVAWKLLGWREHEKFYNTWLKATPKNPESDDTWMEMHDVVFWGIWTGEWKEPEPYKFWTGPHDGDCRQRFRHALELGLLRLAD